MKLKLVSFNLLLEKIRQYLRKEFLRMLMEKNELVNDFSLSTKDHLMPAWSLTTNCSKRYVLSIRKNSSICFSFFTGLNESNTVRD